MPTGFPLQDHPAYCGLGTLVMVLNALSLDPGRVWREGYPWRWYSEEMLDCCKSMQEVRSTLSARSALKDSYCIINS